MEALIKTFPAIVAGTGNSDEVAEAAARAAWKHAVGESLSKHAVAVRLDQKTLIVAVSDAVWQEQLELMSGQLLFRLNSVLGQAVVSFIAFHIDPMTIAASRQSHVARQISTDSPAREVPQELVMAAASIHDKALRQVFIGAASCSLRRLEEGR